MSIKDIIIKAYYDPITGFVGADRLYKKIKNDNPDTGMRLQDVKEVLATLEIPQRFNNKTVKDYYAITAPTLGVYQADLTFFPDFGKTNNGYTIILTVVNIMSRYGYTVPLKHKTADDVETALSDIINETTKIPEATMRELTTDNGTEFLNKQVRDLLERHNIKHYVHNPSDHAHLGKIERFNQTIKNKLKRYMKANDTTRWIDVLPAITTNYNNTIHRGTNKTPKQFNLEDAKELWEKQIKKNQDITARNGIKIGDKVRIKKKHTMFGKDNTKFSKKIYTVEKINTSLTLQNTSSKAGSFKTTLLEKGLTPKTSIGNSVLLNNGVVYRPYELLKVDEVIYTKAEPIAEPRIKEKELKRERRIERLDKQAGVDKGAIIEEKRVRKPNARYQ